MHPKNRIMILIDNIWRSALPIPGSYNENDGSIKANVNGLVVNIKGGVWYNIDNTMSDDQVQANVIQSNLDQLFQIAANKAAHKKTQEMLAARLHQAQPARRAEEIFNPVLPFPAEPPVVPAEPQSAPVEQPPVALRDPDDFDFDDYERYEFLECDCEQCRRSRGEL